MKLGGKYLILQGDGMGDYPLDELYGKTPLEAASTPYMDALAKRGQLGLVRTIPAGMKPGSDVGNMSILGYDPRKYYTGRAPFEAEGIGVGLEEEDVAFRLNLVKLKEENDSIYMEDYSAGHISTPQGQKLIARLNRKLGTDEFQFYPGTGYRHLMVWKKGKTDIELTPPHDIPGQSIDRYLPKGDGGEILTHLIEKSWDILRGQQANSIWLWGCGRPPQLYSLKDKYSLNGFVISAVDLVKGLGSYVGLRPIEVPGATGFIDTNYEGKVKASVRALCDMDFGLVHVEAPDEAGHLGNLGMKLQAIQDFDRKIVGPIWEELAQFEDFSLLVLTDHYTPISTRTHSSEPVPFVIYRSKGPKSLNNRGYHEKSAQATNLFLKEGHRLLEKFLRGD